jgi:hypothetical protein
MPSSQRRPSSIVPRLAPQGRLPVAPPRASLRPALGLGMGVGGRLVTIIRGKGNLVFCQLFLFFFKFKKPNQTNGRKKEDFFFAERKKEDLTELSFSKK